MGREKTFRFKQFAVLNDRTAMKVGTDGVLLGAWCPVAGAARVLDVGTGCGVIALMIAQRNDTALIEGIDIDPEANSPTDGTPMNKTPRSYTMSLHVNF